MDFVKSNGQKASDGFDALRDLDSNRDGIFDVKDEQFGELKIWQDLNQDGIAEANELKSLDGHNITAINLDIEKSTEDNNGNLISAIGSYSRGDGTSGLVSGNGKPSQAILILRPIHFTASTRTALRWMIPPRAYQI
ncbi:hypothetical protein P4233_13450 [Pseudomonas aeruginosa]|nr:hypothetical protein [Pseudomonas aeruginosa]